MKNPAELDAAINKHRELHGSDPLMVAIDPQWHKQYAYYFNGRVQVLCCGKGMLYRGIPLLFTKAKYVEDFVLSY